VMLCWQALEIYLAKSLVKGSRLVMVGGKKTGDELGSPVPSVIAEKFRGCEFSNFHSFGELSGRRFLIPLS